MKANVLGKSNNLKNLFYQVLVNIIQKHSNQRLILSFTHDTGQFARRHKSKQRRLASIAVISPVNSKSRQHQKNSSAHFMQQY